LTNAGEERFDGFEIDAEIALTREVRGAATYAYHDATFRDYVQAFDGTPTQLKGKSLELSPKNLASAGLSYDDSRVFGEGLINVIGERFLTKRNTASADGYATIDAAAGVHLGQVDLQVAGHNLTDRRDPVAESELGEAQYYRLPARRVEAGATYHL
jgi:iron complex outermembrane receptor protein